MIYLKERLFIIKIRIKNDKMESFKLAKGEEDICGSPETNSQDGGEGNLESLETFINESFHEALINKIKEEIKISVKDELNKLNINTKNTTNQDIENEGLITQLNNEIKILKARTIITKQYYRYLTKRA